MIRDVEHVLAYRDTRHATNQGSIIRLDNGDLLLGYNEERGRVHSDSGQSCLVRSSDGGRTWDPRPASSFGLIPTTSATGTAPSASSPMAPC